MTANELVRSILLTHELFLSRLEASERKEFRKIMGKELKQVILKLQNLDAKRTRSARLKQIREYIEDTSTGIEEAYSAFSEEYRNRLVELALYENKKALEILERATGVELVASEETTKMLSTETARVLVDDTWISGATVKEMLKHHTATFIEDFKVAVRTGFLRGESYEVIAERLKGYVDGDGVIYTSLLDKELKKADMVIRTSILGIANKARDDMYNNNKDVLRGKMWLSTLDVRTCLACGNLDGAVWDMNGKGIEGTTADFSIPPLHPNCRCTLLPILKAWEDIDKELSETRRASMTGQIPANITFDEWFESLNPLDQEELLGKGRFELYKKKKLTFADLIDQNGRGLTLEELKKIYE